MLTGINLTSTFSVMLLHTTVLIQGHYESGWQPSQFQKLRAVQLAGHQHVFSRRTLVMQLHLGEKGRSSCPCCLLLKVRQDKTMKNYNQLGGIETSVSHKPTSRFRSFCQVSPSSKQNLSNCVFS